MAKLSQSERESLKEFAKQKPLQQLKAPSLPISEYLRYLSELPKSLQAKKSERFTGNRWRL